MGAEAYSLALLFKETLDALKPRKTFKDFSLQIFATDLDSQAIDKAREGVYPAGIAADVSSERLSRFFVKTERGYRVTIAADAHTTFDSELLDAPTIAADAHTQHIWNGRFARLKPAGEIDFAT